MAVVAGALGEDSLLVLDGLLGDAEWSLAATASSSQLGGPLLDGDGSLVGPSFFQAAGEIGAGGHARTVVLAANRLIWGAIALLLVGSLLTWAGGPQVAAFLTGR
ncbi:MAG: hypothetical protein H0W81_13270 [Chloroflexi bacterium]|nr:hypothetical protein [Chloroflexota bacterium]